MKDSHTQKSIAWVDVTYDVVNDKTEELMTAARRLVEAEAAIAEAKAELKKALDTRKGFIEGVVFQLDNGRNAVRLDVI